MISTYVITSDSWTPVTTAGQSGTCWINEDGDSGKGTQDVRIYPSLTLPGDSDLPKSKRVYKPRGNEDVLCFDANDTLEILYARCLRSGETAKLHVSVN